MRSKILGEWYNFVSMLIYLRESNGLTKEEMASMLGIGVKTLEKIEKGELPERLGANIVMAITKHFGISPSDQWKGNFKD